MTSVIGGPNELVKLSAPSFSWEVTTPTGEAGAAGGAGSGGSSGQVIVVALIVVQTVGVALATPAAESTIVIVFPAAETLIVLATSPLSLIKSSLAWEPVLSPTVVAAASACAAPKKALAAIASAQQAPTLFTRLPISMPPPRPISR
jgi:hypothetical protein